MRTWMTMVGVVVIGGGALAYAFFRDGGPDYEVTDAEAFAGTVAMTIDTSGTLEPLSTVEVGCEVTGKIVEFGADRDDPVKAGLVICRISPELAQAEHDQALADFTRANSALTDAELAREEQMANLPILTQQAKAAKDEADAALISEEFNWRRVDGLYQQQDASEAEWVAVKARYLRAKALAESADAAYKLALNNEKTIPKRAEEAVEQAKSASKLAEARLNFAKTRLGNCTITSPIDGIVLMRPFDVGATVNATFATPTLFVLAPSLDRMLVRARVSESDISYIEEGQPARFRVEARQTLDFEGVIQKKFNQPETIQNVTTYTVIFEVRNDERTTLLPGLSVNVEIECARKEGIPLIANAALRFTPPIDAEERRALEAAVQWPERPDVDARGGSAEYCSKARAWTFDPAAGSWKAVPLWVGITDNAYTEILWGAEVGDRFVRKFRDRSDSSWSFKEAVRLAAPDNRTL